MSWPRTCTGPRAVACRAWSRARRAPGHHGLTALSRRRLAVTAAHSSTAPRAAAMATASTLFAAAPMAVALPSWCSAVVTNRAAPSSDWLASADCGTGA